MARTPPLKAPAARKEQIVVVDEFSVETSQGFVQSRIPYSGGGGGT